MATDAIIPSNMKPNKEGDYEGKHVHDWKDIENKTHTHSWDDIINPPDGGGSFVLPDDATVKNWKFDSVTVGNAYLDSAGMLLRAPYNIITPDGYSDALTIKSGNGNFLVFDDSGNRKIDVGSNINLNGNWLSGDGTDTGIYIDPSNPRRIGFNNNAPTGTFPVRVEFTNDDDDLVFFAVEQTQADHFTGCVVRNTVSGQSIGINIPGTYYTNPQYTKFNNTAYINSGACDMYLAAGGAYAVKFATDQTDRGMFGSTGGFYLYTDFDVTGNATVSGTVQAEHIYSTDDIVADGTVFTDYLDDNGAGAISALATLNVTGSIDCTGTLTVDDIDDSGQGYIGILSNLAMGSFWISGDGANEGIRVDTSGFVGIQRSPGYTFDVALKSGAATGTIARFGYTTLSRIEIGVEAYSGVLSIYDSGSAEDIRLDAAGTSFLRGGYVAIAKTTADYTFDCNGPGKFNTILLGNNGASLQVDSPSGNSNLGLDAEGTGAVVFGFNDGTGGVRFYDGAGGEFARFQGSTGRLGIGTDTPSELLDVDGDIKTRVDLHVGGVAYLDDIDDSGQGYIDCATDFNLVSSVLQVDGTQVVGAQGATISDPAGGATVDSEARTAINTIIDRLQAHGLIA